MEHLRNSFLFLKNNLQNLTLSFSPVIKVGKAEDASVNTHTAISDSDEEFQLHVSVSSKRIKSNLF